MSKRTGLLVVALIGAMGWVAPASAQIYMWHDAAGNLVLSDRPQNGVRPTKSYAVPNAGSFRAAKPATHYRNQYDATIQIAAKRYSVRPDLVRAVMQAESGFNPRARSVKGAMGLMQLMPETAVDMGVRKPYNPDQNIKGGVRYLRVLLDRYNNDEQLALAAYNAGPGNVEKYGYTVPPFRETQDYVNRIQGKTPLPGAAVRTMARASSAPAAADKAPQRFIYKWVELTSDGRPMMKLSSTKPTSGSYETISLGR